LLLIRLKPKAIETETVIGIEAVTTAIGTTTAEDVGSASSSETVTVTGDAARLAAVT
jgi:hypothetical protein